MPFDLTHSLVTINYVFDFKQFFGLRPSINLEVSYLKVTTNDRKILLISGQGRKEYISNPSTVICTDIYIDTIGW